ncbi:DUF2877 domain-containing protein [Nocardioides rotundus]|uniref:oxamate carbamoyltransferase subunit AllH family protein n=1 Tax=Nocardioides rotundus TaxID=1774216 RepID=UPI001CBB6942|nr:DUF2877 domain-containing protein [Nocardioides rotundus]UAL28435.1 DUF2877 domain-containing protein [Nocardioides rotundus]
MLPAAASPLAPWPGSGTARVRGVLPAVLYLEHPGGVAALETARGAGLPIAWRLGVPAVDWGVAVGDVVSFHADGLDLPAGPVRRVRAWRPARVRRRPRETRGLARSVARVAERVGEGPGLTPEADDELCGLLLMAYAAGLDVDVPAGRTTALSAALLRAAASGYAVAAAVRVADALAAGRPASSRDVAEVDGLGATSGRALLRGLRAGTEELVHG